MTEVCNGVMYYTSTCTGYRIGVEHGFTGVAIVSALAVVVFLLFAVLSEVFRIR